MFLKAVSHRLLPSHLLTVRVGQGRGDQLWVRREGDEAQRAKSLAHSHRGSKGQEAQPSLGWRDPPLLFLSSSVGEHTCVLFGNQGSHSLRLARKARVILVPVTLCSRDQMSTSPSLPWAWRTMKGGMSEKWEPQRASSSPAGGHLFSEVEKILGTVSIGVLAGNRWHSRIGKFEESLIKGPFIRGGQGVREPWRSVLGPVTVPQSHP